MNEVYTREMYMNNEGFPDTDAGRTAAHRKYNAQFVSPGLVNAVEGRIGLARLLASTDRHLNDIPLHEWDRLDSLVISYGAPAKMKQCGEYLSLAGIVCIAKEAARQAIERAKARQNRQGTGKDRT